VSVALVTHSHCILHEMGAHHPESPERLKAVLDALDASGFGGQLVEHEAPAAAAEDLARVHDEEHVATRGFSCPKGLHQQEIYASPDRLLHPEKRTGDRWDRVGWEQALSEIGAKVRRIREEHGPDSIAMYVGTAAGFGVLHPVFAQGFMTGLGSRSMYSSSTQDCANKFAVAREMYGFPFTQPFPDLERTRCLVIVGANPVISKWSFLQVPNPARALQAIEARGGRIFVVDPRRTETARAAGEHVFIRPDTDVFFYLSFLREILQGDIDAERVGRVATGLDEVRARPLDLGGAGARQRQSG